MEVHLVLETMRTRKRWLHISKCYSLVWLWIGPKKSHGICTETPFLNIEYAKSLSNESVNDTKNLGKLTEKSYRKTTTSFKIVAKN